jgi:hypothetical protein
MCIQESFYSYFGSWRGIKVRGNIAFVMIPVLAALRYL